MANNIGWGQAHANNDIGYGQGGVNNTIDWAKMYKRSNSGETVLSPEDATYFGIVVDTTQTGVSNNDQFEFTGGLGDYDVTALQNDTEVATFSDLSGAATITLPSAGVYELRVQPKEVNGFNRIRFANRGDKDKLTEIKSWGTDVVWSSFNGAFRGCVNLGDCNIADVPNLTNVTSMREMFRDASSFTSDLSDWNVNNVTDMAGMFRGASNFSSNLSSWDVNNVTDMAGMFRGASNFSSNLSSWDVSSVADMSSMFLFADINEAGTTTNYDNLLNGWSALTLQNNVSFNAGSSQYSAAGEVGRNILINTYNWTISDAGLI